MRKIPQTNAGKPISAERLNIEGEQIDMLGKLSVQAPMQLVEGGGGPVLSIHDRPEGWIRLVGNTNPYQYRQVTMRQGGHYDQTGIIANAVAYEVNGQANLDGEIVLSYPGVPPGERLFQLGPPPVGICRKSLCVQIGCDRENDGGCDAIGMGTPGSLTITGPDDVVVYSRTWSDYPYVPGFVCVDLTNHPLGTYTVTLTGGTVTWGGDPWPEYTSTTTGETVTVNVSECKPYTTCAHFFYSTYDVTLCAYGLCSYEVPEGGVGYYDRIPLPGVTVSFDDGVNSGSGVTGEDGCARFPGLPLTENPGVLSLTADSTPGGGNNCGWGAGSNSTSFNPGCSPGASLALYMPLNADMVCACAASGSPYTHWAWPKELSYSDDYGSCTLTFTTIGCGADRGRHCWKGSYSYGGPVAWLEYDPYTRKCKCKVGSGSTTVQITAWCGAQYSYHPAEFYVHRYYEMMQCKDAYNNNICKLYDSSKPLSIWCGLGAFGIFQFSPDMLSEVQGTPPNVNISGTFGSSCCWGIADWLLTICSGIDASTFTITGSC